MFVLPSGSEAASMDINISKLEELDGVLYYIHIRTTNENEMLRGIPDATTKNVHIYVCNYRRILRALFQPNLFRMTSVMEAPIIFLMDTGASAQNARQLLMQVNQIIYFYTKPLGFV